MNKLVKNYGGGVRKKGNVYYYFFEGKSLNDKKRNRIEKSARTSNKSEALKLLEKAIEEYYISEIDFTLSDISFAEAREKFLSEYVANSLKDSTYTNYKQILNKPQIKVLEIYLLKDIRAKHIQNIIDDMALNGFSKNMVKNTLRTISSLFNFCIRAELIKDNPCDKVVIPSKLTQPERKVALTSKEVKKILNRFENTHWYLSLMLPLYTGMRRGECCGLCWKNVDLEKGVLYVKENLTQDKDKKWVITTPKTKSSIRTINIPLPLLEALKWQLERNKSNNVATNSDTHVLVRDNGSIITNDTLKYLSRVINYDLGIKFNYHNLRHTYATLLIEKGANIKDVSVLLGHASIKTTMDIYVNNTDNMRDKTLNILNTLYE